MNNEEITIGIAEDNCIILEGIQTYLGKFENFKITFTALDGVDAIYMLQQQKLPNVLILDLNMPSLNGYEVLEYIKNRNLNIYTIVFSSYVTDSISKKCISLGANIVLEKSITNNNLYHAILDSSISSNVSTKDKDSYSN